MESPSEAQQGYTKPREQILGVLRSVRFGAWSVPAALLFVIFLAFGLLAAQLGFYQDDWQEVWYARSFGPSIFIRFFANERPFNAWVHILTHSLAGDQMLNWHILAMAARWLSAGALWWALRMLWPRQPWQTAAISLLYAIYPLFKEQTIAVTYSPFFLLIACNFLSLGAMLLAVRRPRQRIPLTLLALISGAFPLLSLEHFFPLELLRPFLLWLVVSEERLPLKDRLRKTFLNWLPYLAGTLAFLYWRLFIFKFPTYQPQLTAALRANPIQALIDLALTIVQDSFEVTIFAWVQTLEFTRTIDASLLSWLKLWGLVLLAGAAAAFYLSRLDLKPAASDNSSNTWSWQAIGIGLISLLLMGWPAWFTQLKIDLSISGERFTLVYMPSMSILVVGLLELLVRTRVQKSLLLGAMVGLAMGMHFTTAREFRRVNLEHETFFRQLAWRIPALEPGTLFLTNPFPSDYSGSSQFMSALNWLYDEQPEKPELDYMWFYIPERLGGDLPGLEADLPVSKGYRTLMYTGSTSQAVVAFYEPPGCLLVIDPEVHGRLARLPEYIREAAPLSKPGRILPQGTWAAETVDYLYGSQAADSWCAYFEKADLARQLGDWDEVVRLGEEAAREGLLPGFKQDWEYFPFIEGYARSGDWDQALKLTRMVEKGMPAANEAQCALWERIVATTPAGEARDAALAEANALLGCETP